MRDIVLTTIVFGFLPFILKWPYVGVLVWTWLGFMNPHRLTWNFAYSMPFAYIVAIATLLGLFMSRESKRVPWTRETVALLLLVGWFVLTTFFAAFPQLAWLHLEKVVKIQLMVFVTLILMRSKERINLLVLVMALSLAFYGVKGGIFTILHGGTYHVRGPEGSFIGGDNEIGLALVMTIPLLRYLQMAATGSLARLGLTLAMLLSTVAAIGSQSRGALLGVVGMGVFFWLKSRNKIAMMILGLICLVVVVNVMPDKWFDRISTITQYEQDKSAMGRINAWRMAINLASHQLLGGGFDAFQAPMFAIYAPDPEEVHDAHSIYFEILGEHGFIGLFLFLLLFAMTWLSATDIIKRCRKVSERRWMADLASMVQVSLVGYAVAGAFLGLAYFDFYYTLIAVIVLCKSLLYASEGKDSARRAPEGAFKLDRQAGSLSQA